MEVVDLRTDRLDGSIDWAVIGEQWGKADLA